MVLLYDGSNIPEPSRLLYCLCSTHHNLSPTNAVPNSDASAPRTHPTSTSRSFPSTASLNRLQILLAGSLNEDVHDLCLLHLSKSVYPSNRISVVSDPCTATELLPAKPNIYTLYSKPNVHAIGGHYENPSVYFPSHKLS